MKNHSSLRLSAFTLLALLPTLVLGLLLGRSAITWGASFDNDLYPLLLLIGGIGGLIVGYAEKPKAWLAVIFGYTGLPIGILISSMAYMIPKSFSVDDILSIFLVTFGFYVMFPVMNLLFTWPFIVILLLIRGVRRVTRRPLSETV